MKLGDDEFTVVAVQSTASQQSTSYPATIKGVQDIEVRPQVSGFIVKLCVDEGATVRKARRSFRSILHSMRLPNVRQKLL